MISIFFIRAHRCILLFVIFRCFFPAEVSHGGLSNKQEFLCPVRAVEINDHWLSLQNTPYWFEAMALIIFWTGKCFYHDLIDYAQTRCCYYTASTYIMCETLYPPTVFLFYSLGLKEEIWMPPSVHTFTLSSWSYYI